MSSKDSCLVLFRKMTFPVNFKRALCHKISRGFDVEFHWSAAWLWRAFKFLCRPETWRSPLRELPLLKRINRVFRFVGFSWKLARMFVRYQLTQSIWSFYEIRSISLVTCRSVTVTEILFIVKLQNRFSQAPIEISKKTSHTLLAY